MKSTESIKSVADGFKTIAVGLAANVALLAAAADAGRVAKYHLVPIEPGLGKAQVTVMDMNRHAQVVGAAADDWSEKATIYLWSAWSTMPVPSLPGASWTWPWSVNDFGQVVGQDSLGDPANPSQGGWFWSPGMSRVSRLRQLRHEDNWVGVNQVDNAGRIIGYSGQMSGGFWTIDAVVWTSHKASPLRLKTLPGLSSSARGINANHPPQIVGFGFPQGSDSTAGHPLFWENPWAAPRVLPGLGAEVGVAVAINDKGQIAGFSGPVPGESPDNGHAVLWEKGQLLELAPGYAYSEVLNVGAINNRCQIVGGAVMADGVEHAVLWSRHGARIEMVDLNERLMETTSCILTFGDAVNEDGCIIVDAFDQNDPDQLNRAFLLVPDDCATARR